MRRPATLSLAAIILLSGLLVGCGDTEDRDLCTQYEELVAEVDDLRDVDIDPQDLGVVRDEVDDVIAALDQLLATVDNRYAQEIQTVKDEVRGLQSIILSDDAISEKAELLADSIDDTREAFAALRAALDPNCPGL